MRRIVTVMLALMLALMCAPAMADEAPITLTAMQYELENQDIDFNNLWYFKQIEEQTGVHVDFIEVKDGDWEQQINLMFVSGQYPDLIIRDKRGLDIEEYGVTQKLLLPLEDYLEEYMPNYYSRLKMNNADASMYASDGHMYYIGYLMAQNVNHDGTWYINTTWLDELGLDIPETVDELTEVLYAFKEARPECIPFTADLQNMTEGLWSQFAMFGVPENSNYMFIDTDEKVKFTGAQAGWYDCVEWLNKLYSDGILDQEVFTQDSNGWGQKMNEGITGYTCYLRLINTALKPEIYANFKSILPPKAEGYEVKVSSILELPDQGARLTVNLKDDEEKLHAALRWLDAQFATENMMVSLNGPIGGNGPIEDTMLINAEGKYEVIYVPENNGLYSIVPLTCGQFFAPGDYYTAVYQMAPHRVERYLDSMAYAEAGVLEYKSFHYLTKLVKKTNDEATEVARIFTELDKYMKNSLTDFVINGITEEKYQTFLKTCEDMGLDRYIQIYQDGYDRYLATL